MMIVDNQFAFAFDPNLKSMFLIWLLMEVS